MREVKQIVKQTRKSAKNCSKMLGSTIIESSQRSSVVEQRFRKPPVVSSTLTAGCIYNET